MGAHGLWREHQLGRDLGPAHALGKMPKNLAFALRQGYPATRAAYGAWRGGTDLLGSVQGRR
jgi:hypothetical protein